MCKVEGVVSVICNCNISFPCKMECVIESVMEHPVDVVPRKGVTDSFPDLGHSILAPPIISSDGNGERIVRPICKGETDDGGDNFFIYRLLRLGVFNVHCHNRPGSKTSKVGVNFQ